MKVGDKINFYVFSVLEEGTITEINKDKTLQIAYGGVIYPSVQTYKKLPKNKKEIPPWYILK
tara:strand:- start:228 stop:413 length:186 start_codon:yes stop_codon:yes gene_type:complete